MMRRTCLLLAAILLPSCSAVPDEPRGPQDLAATQRAKDLLWIVESESGATISSATAFGPGRLLTTATAVEDWVGQRLRVRRDGTVLPVRTMQLAVGQNFAILQVQDPRLEAPRPSARPGASQRLFMAAANGGNVFDGAGQVARTLQISRQLLPAIGRIGDGALLLVQRERGLHVGPPLGDAA